MIPEFQAFPKTVRLYRDSLVTEKIDGTNACVIVNEHGVFAQSRKRIITPDVDNFGFARWVSEHEDELQTLGEGYHFGEWYGSGIQRGYGLSEKRFALFNAARWADERPACCETVPVLARFTFDTHVVQQALAQLREEGSQAVPGYMNPEGVIVWHNAGRVAFKVLLEGDDLPKSLAA